MDGVGERKAHQPRRGDGAVEARVGDHVDDGGDAAPFLADRPRIGAVEFDLGRSVGAVAELVLQPLQMQRVDAAVRQEARHQKARQAIWRLRQDEEGVRHRRRQEPLVAGDAVFAAAADQLGLGRRRAHVGAALLLRHAHAEGDGGLGRGRRKARIVAVGEDARQPLGRHVRLLQQHRHGGVGHGDGAAVPRLHLRRHVEGAGAGHMRAGAPRLALLGEMRPNGGMQSLGAARAHQRVVGGMERHGIAPTALPVVRRQLGRVLVGKAAALLRLGAAGNLSEPPSAPARHRRPPAPPRQSAPASDVKRFTSSNGGGWLKTSCVVESGAHGPSLSPCAGENALPSLNEFPSSVACGWALGSCPRPRLCLYKRL